MEELFTVNFKFVVDQRVTTPFDEKGIVTMMAYDDGGILYHVKSKSSSNWFKENELSRAVV